MCPAGTAPDPRQVVVPLIAIGLQIPGVAFQELFCMAAALGRGIAIQDDRRKSILTTPEQPHERLGLGSAPFLIQYLDSCLICHCKVPFQQFAVKVIIHWLKIVLRTEDFFNFPGSASCQYRLIWARQPQRMTPFSLL